METKIFIQANNKQYFGALLSKYSLQKNISDKSIEVVIMNVDNHPAFKNFIGKKYLRGGVEVVYGPADLQSFTLSRFMPPELMNFQGRALVVDPDVFALQDITPLLTMDMEGQAIASCKKTGGYETSVMLLDCAKLTDWKIASLIEKISKNELDYNNIMSLRIEKRIKEIPRFWNDLDTLTPQTRMIHMSGRLTQPWKTGLPIDFRREPLPKIAGIIPREPIYRLIGKYPTRYLRHKNKEIENLFFSLVKNALADGAITEADIQKEINDKNVRADLLEKIKTI